MTIWDKYPDYTSDEFRLLTAVTAETLVDMAGAQSTTEGISPDVLKLSTKAAAAQLQQLLHEGAPDVTREQVQEALEDSEQSRQMALSVLNEVRRIPDVSDAIAKAYEAKSREMAGPELMLLAAAVVILAIKVKNVNFSGHGVRADFYQAGEAVKTFVTGIVGR